MNEEIKQESSIPTAARVSLVTLAELAQWWESTGYKMITTSQLISWSLELLRNSLRLNRKISEIEMSVASANRYLTEKGLYQRNVRNRSIKKVATAIRFEGMREEGYNPTIEDPINYKMVHKSSSVRPFEGQIDLVQLEGYPDGYMYRRGDEEGRDRLIEKLRTEGIKSVREQVDENLAQAKEGMIAVKKE